MPGTAGWELGCAVKERPGGETGGPEVTVRRMLRKGFCGGWRFKAPEEVMLEVSLTYLWDSENVTPCDGNKFDSIL